MHYEEIIYYERKEAAEAAAEAATKAARVQDILDLLEEYGEVPETVKRRLNEEENADVLRKWLKVAAGVESIGEFMDKLKKEIP